MTSLRPPPRRSHSPACPPTASHATPPSRRVWVPGRAKGQITIKIPHNHARIGIPESYDVRAWNEAVPKELRLKMDEHGRLFTSRNPYELGPGLVHQCLEKAYKASYGFTKEDHNPGSGIFTMYLHLPAQPGHWQPCRVGAKNRAALGWPAVDKPARP